MSKCNPRVFSKPESLKDEALAEQAIAWFSKQQTGGLSMRDTIRFQTWKAQSPAHERAYREISQLWGDADFTQALTQTALSYRPTEKTPGARVAHYGVPLALAASIAVCLLLSDSVTRLQADYYTPIGGRQTVALLDGSRVVLNTDTAVAVAFTPQTRRLRLLKGEAYFEVRRDENKPFVVDSEDTQTEVLGTRFIVRDGDAEDKITVLQGLVQVSNKVRKQQVLLRADEQVASSASGLTAIQRLASPHETGWLQDRLSFQDAPLADVVNDLDRYIPGIIVFSNHSVKTYRINARFDITQPVRALDTLAETLPIKITHVGDWLTVIGRK